MNKLRYSILSLPLFNNRYFEGEDTTGGGNKDDDTVGGGGGEDKMIKQSEVNRMLSENKKSLQNKVSELTGLLKQQQDQSKMSAAEKKKLADKIESLESEFRSKEETLQQQFDQYKTTVEGQITGLTGERDGWKTRYTSSLIRREISDAATTAEAFSPKQINALLSSNAYMKEQTGEDGKPNGEFEVRIKFEGKGKDGKAKTLDLSATEAVKAMQEMPEYFNLFKATAKGGMGGSNGGSTTVNSLKDMGMEDYRKNRPQILQQVK